MTMVRVPGLIPAVIVQLTSDGLVRSRYPIFVGLQLK